jgi:hypothetical protein
MASKKLILKVYSGGADRDRTDDLLNAIQALSQLSYSPNELRIVFFSSMPEVDFNIHSLYIASRIVL